jgi:hypothetical protein
MATNTSMTDQTGLGCVEAAGEPGRAHPDPGRRLGSRLHTHGHGDRATGPGLAPDHHPAGPTGDTTVEKPERPATRLRLVPQARIAQPITTPLKRPNGGTGLSPGQGHDRPLQ